MLPLALAIVASLGCAGGEGERRNSSPLATDASTSNLVDALLSEDDRRALASAAPAQAATATDGRLTFAEYERAMLALVDCFDSAGAWLTHGVRLTAYGTYYLEWNSEPTQQSQDAGFACLEEHFLPLHDIWSRARPPLPQSLLQDAHQLLWSCAEEEGADFGAMPPGPQAFEVWLEMGDRANLDIFRACQQRVFEELNVPDWVG